MSFIGSRRVLLGAGFDPVYAKWRQTVIADGGRFTSLTDYQFNLCIERLRSTGLLPGIDVLKFYMGDDTGNVPHAAKFDLIGLRSGTMHSTPVLTPGKGITGDGAASYDDIAWNPATQGVKYTQNLASEFMLIQTPDSRSAAIYTLFGKGNNPGANLSKATGSTTMTYAINNSSATTITTSIGVTTPGFWYAERSAVSVTGFGVNGATLAAAALTSSAVSSFNWYTLCGNNAGTPGNFSNATIGIVGAGTAFGQAGSTLLYQIFYAAAHGISPVFYP